MTVANLILSLADFAQAQGKQAFFYSLVLIPLVYLIVNEFVRASARVPNLKGPRGWPLIGNLMAIRYNASEQYRKWANKFGPVYQIQLGNVPIVVVNTAAAAKVIFAHNSNALSSRPEFYTFHKVRIRLSNKSLHCNVTSTGTVTNKRLAFQIVSNTAGTTIGTSPYSDSLKRRRKGAASALNRPSVQSYSHHLDVETADFIKELYLSGEAGKTPVNPFPMIQRLSLSMATTVNWGYRVKSQQDDIFNEIIYVEDKIAHFRSTTGNLQDYIPLLRLNPFNSHSASAREMRRRRDAYLDKLNSDLDERIANGTHSPCIQANVLLDKEAKLNKEELTSISLTMLSGGLDTMTTTLSWGVAFLSQHPEIQEKAYAEICKMEGVKLPMCETKDDLSCKYVAAFVRECLRYYTILRLSLPRTSIQDIVYEGSVIPKGSTFFLNAWACNMGKFVTMIVRFAHF